VRRTKRAIRKAFEVQLAGKGFSLVEILSPCPTYWRMTPIEAIKHLDETLTRAFPPGVFRDVTASETQT
jgi:2-oxoglutarate ferredoxin oxidoreductase subunit beta